MKLTVALRPDRNRDDLGSHISRRLKEGIFEDSLSSSRVRDRAGRVLLIVPYYTRIKRPLDLVKESVQTWGKECLEEDLDFINSLKEKGVSSLNEMKRAGVPMGLLRVGTAAKKAGYDVKVLDAVFEGWNDERRYFESESGSSIFLYGLTKNKIAEKIREYCPDVVGISIDYSHQWGNAREVADLIKRIDEKIPVVVGGTHATGLPGDVLFDSPSDYVVLRQADKTFVDLLDALTKRTKPLEEVKGIAFRKEGKLVRTSPRAFLSDIDEISIPDLSLVNLNLYSGPFHSAGKRVVSYGKLMYGFTSVGCDVRCTFCTIPPVQGGYKAVGCATLEDYLKYVISEGVSEFIVEDDHLFSDPERALEVFALLRKYNLPWVEEGGIGLFSLIALLPEVSEEYILKSVNNPLVFEKALNAKRRGLSAEELIRAMSESGCYSAYLAVESANEQALDTSHKPLLNSQVDYTKKVVNLLDKYKIKTTAGLMLGFVNPDRGLYVESRRNIERTIEYGRVLKEAGITYVNPFIFTPLPGAPHFRSLEKYVIPNTDESFSHEFGSIDAPNGEWNRDHLNLLRTKALIKSNGVAAYKRILETGTWPVETV